MGGHKHFAATSYETIPTETLAVSGDGSPSPNGLYTRQSGLHNTQKFYRRDDNAYYIWWSIFFSQWILSVILDNTDDCWYRDGLLNILGEYTPGGEYLGNPVVS